MVENDFTRLYDNVTERSIEALHRTKKWIRMHTNTPRHKDAAATAVPFPCESGVGQPSTASQSAAGSKQQTLFWHCASICVDCTLATVVRTYNATVNSAKWICECLEL